MNARATPTPRNHRNNPYVIDSLLVTVHRSAAGVLWQIPHRANHAVGRIRGHLAARPGAYHPVGARRHRRHHHGHALLCRSPGGSSSGAPGA